MESLIYTGERAIPGLAPKSTMVHHLARYELATGFAAHKRVVDACCGAGYGSAMMAEVAYGVVGFDVDEETIAYARAQYTNLRLRFEQCDIRNWREVDFDLVVAFEALEHVSDCKAAVESLYRSLRPGGMVLASVPVAASCWDSPYHVRCYERPEFQELMEEWFNGWIWGQAAGRIHADMADPSHWVFVGRKK